MEKMTNMKALVYVMDNCTLPEEVAEKVNGMIAQLEKRAHAKRSTKPTKAQIANEGFKAEIVALLGDGEARTAKAIAEAVEGVKSSQHASALLTQLIKANLVVRNTVKGTSYFTVA